MLRVKQPTPENVHTSSVKKTAKLTSDVKQSKQKADSNRKMACEATKDRKHRKNVTGFYTEYSAKFISHLQFKNLDDKFLKVLWQF